MIDNNFILIAEHVTLSTNKFNKRYKHDGWNSITNPLLCCISGYEIVSIKEEMLFLTFYFSITCDLQIVYSWYKFNRTSATT